MTTTEVTVGDSATTCDDDEAMATGAEERQGDPEDEDQAEGDGIQPPPEDGGDEVGREVLPGPELVRQRQPGAEVGVEVQQVP